MQLDITMKNSRYDSGIKNGNCSKSFQFENLFKVGNF